MGWIIDKISDIADNVTDGILMGLVSAAGATLGLVVDAIDVIDEITVRIKGIITRERAEEEARSHGLENAIIEMADKETNTISIADWDRKKRVRMSGDGISDDIEAGICI